MTHCPSLVPILKKFGLEPNAFSSFLLCSGGFVAGGSASTAFFGKPLFDNQDLDVWVPLPVTKNNVSTYTAKRRWDTAHYCTLIKNAVHNFFTRNQQAPSRSRLLSMSLDQIAEKYCGVYSRIATKDVAEYTKSTISSFINSIDTFENTWTGRRIQVIYTYDVSLSDILSSFDMDVSQFYTDGSFSFIIKHNHSASVLNRLRNGNARILINTIDILTEYQQTRLSERIAKYEERGYTFTWASTGCPWRVSFIPDAPDESFYQEFILTTSDFWNNTSDVELRNYLRGLFEGAQCNFKEAEMEKLINYIVVYMNEQLLLNKKNGDNWQYTWRFTWNAENKTSNIYPCKLLLLNFH